MFSMVPEATIVWVEVYEATDSKICVLDKQKIMSIVKDATAILFIALIT